jgi:hypothetical protein
MNIAITSCSNVKDDCSCAGAGCMGSFNKRLAAFDAYTGEEIVLVGIIRAQAARRCDSKAR